MVGAVLVRERRQLPSWPVLGLSGVTQVGKELLTELGVGRGATGAGSFRQQPHCTLSQVPVPLTRRDRSTLARAFMLQTFLEVADPSSKDLKRWG